MSIQISGITTQSNHIVVPVYNRIGGHIALILVFALLLTVVAGVLANVAAPSIDNTWLSLPNLIG